MFRRVRLRLTLLLVLLFLFLYVTSSILIYGLTASLTLSDIDNVLQDTATPLAAEVRNSLDRGVFPTEFIALTRLASLYPKVSAVILRDAMGNVIANTNSDVSGRLPYLYIPQTHIISAYQSSSHTWMRVLTVRLQNHFHQTEAYLQVSLNINHDFFALERLRNVLLEVGLAGSILALLTGFYMSRISLKPVQRSWDLQRRFIADASHELRTPLSVLALNLAVVRDHPERTVEQQANWLDVIERELERLTRLTEDLLTLSRADATESFARVQPVDVITIATTIQQTFNLSAKAKGLTLFVDYLQEKGAPSLWIDGDPDRIFQLFSILVDNAIKYTTDGEIRISLKTYKQQIKITVQDTGMGIAADQVPHIFDRFFRADQARSTTGTGLGLSIASWIVRGHQGKISVHSVEGKGSEFIVLLPRRTAHFFGSH